MARSSLIPGFRFHPTDEELVMYYLKRKLLRKKIMVNAIAEVNIYDFSPWDLPAKSSLRSGDLEWYFFCPKSRKYSIGGRSNRATETGYWKATGKDRTVKYTGRPVATIKTLVFHRWHQGKGQRTDWVMYEYKMEDEHLANAGIAQDAYVLCKVFEKSGSGPKNGAQYGAPFNEEEWEHDDGDLAHSFISQVVAGQVGASNRVDNKQKCQAVTNYTEPGSSTVTFSANKSTYKPMDPAALNIAALQSTHGLYVTEPGSSTVTFSANKYTYKQMDPAALNMAALQSTYGLSVTERGSSTVTFSVNKSTYKQTDPAALNMAALQSSHGLSVTEPGSCSFTLPANDDAVSSAYDEGMFIEDLGLLLGSEDVEAANVETVVANEGEDFFDELVNLIDLDESKETDLKPDRTRYTFDELLPADDVEPDLWGFFVD